MLNEENECIFFPKGATLSLQWEKISEFQQMNRAIANILKVQQSLFVSRWLEKLEKGEFDLEENCCNNKYTGFFYKKHFCKKMSLKNLETLRKW